jgi:hypothetical protein
MQPAKNLVSKHADLYKELTTIPYKRKKRNKIDNVLITSHCGALTEPSTVEKQQRVHFAFL